MSEYHLNKAIYELTRRPDRREVMGDKEAYFEPYNLAAAERTALLKPDFPALQALGLLPNLLYRFYLLHDLPASEFRAHMADDAGSDESTQSEEW